MRQFITIYRGHGGTVQTTDPVILPGGFDAADAISKLFTAVGNRHKSRPQLFLVILPTKDAFMYNRVKKSCDCRFGVVSQCIQVNHMMKNVPQYHSNICMKINCKLGGTTCRVALVSCIFSSYLLFNANQVLEGQQRQPVPGIDSDHRCRCVPCGTWI